MKTLHISSAVIKGLNDKVWYFDDKCFWAWSIFFDDCPSIVHNLPWIYAGQTEEEAKQLRHILKERFRRKGIYEGTRVAILLDEDGIVAIGVNGKDSWIHVRDKCKSKTFKKLGLEFENIIVHCNY